MDIASLSIRVDSAPALSGAQDLDKLTASAAKADAATDRLAVNAGKVGPALSGAGQGSRMFAMQLSQVAQQGAATGNYMQALAIQAPDLAMGFGAVGIAAGVLASVALPVLASSLFDNANNATALSSALEELTTATEDFRIASEAIRLGIDEREVRIIEELNRKVAELAGAEAGLRANRRSQEHVDRLRAEVIEIQNQLQAYRNNRAEMEKFEYAAKLAADATAGIGLSADGALGAVQKLAGAMWDVAEAAMTRINAERELAQMAIEFSPGGQAMERYGGRGATSNRPVTMGDGTELQSGGASFGGGGGGGMDAYASQLDALVNSISTERQLLEEWYAESEALLMDRRAMELLGAQAHKDALIDLEIEYQNRLREIEADSAQTRLSNTADLFGSLASVMQAGGQRTTKVAAAFAAVEGTINAYAAAIDAMRRQPGVLSVKLAAYASVLAAGLRGVAAIRSAGGVGGGGGASIGGQIAAQGTQQPQLQTVEYLVKGLDRNTRYTVEELSVIFDGITDEAQRRGLQTAIRFV